jgi:mono/diheme cytochrome c family protein
MRKIGWAGLAALGFLSACAKPPPPAPTHDELVTRGKYLVTAIAGCNDCHTRMTPTGPDMAHSLQGNKLDFAPSVPMPWAPMAPEIAGGPAGFSDAQFVSFLQTGVRPDGSHPMPPMPAYRMNPDDAQAVAAYVESLPKAP